MTVIPHTKFSRNPLVNHGVRATTRGVVIHTIEGTDEGAKAWFLDRHAKGLGAHVLIGRELGHAIQICDLDAICYHAAGANSEWIGFEHEGFASYSKARWLLRSNRRLLRMSANRVAWVCYHAKVGEPKHGVNVKGHSDFPAGGHHDPGHGWPWGFYMFLARRAYRALVHSHGKHWA